VCSSDLFADRVFLLDGPLDADGLAAKVRAVARRRDVVAVMVDYLQMLAPPEKADGGKYANREQEVTATAKALHELAVELGAAVVAAAQISRNNYQYALRPRLTDLRESGAIEQYATMVLGLWNSSMIRGAQAAAAGKVPAAPPDGWYWTPQDEDSQETVQAMAMAATHGRTLLEVSILKSRWRGHVGKSVPLMFDGLSGRIDDLPNLPGSCNPAAVLGAPAQGGCDSDEGSGDDGGEGGCNTKPLKNSRRRNREKPAT